MKATATVVIPLAVLVAWLSGGVGHGSQGLPPDLIARAISDGLLRDVSPYPLRHPLNRIEATAGVMYTPYVRIARFARAASLGNRMVSVTDIPPAIIEPVVHTVMRAPSAKAPVEGRPTQMAAILRAPSASSPEVSAFFDIHNLLPALRLESRAKAQVAIGEVLLDGEFVIGVFPLSVLGRDVIEFCSYREFVSGNGGTGHDVVAGYMYGPLREGIGGRTPSAERR